MNWSKKNLIALITGRLHRAYTEVGVRLVTIERACVRKFDRYSMGFVQRQNATSHIEIFLIRKLFLEDDVLLISHGECHFFYLSITPYTFFFISF
jgi:hypothetical protein